MQKDELQKPPRGLLPKRLHDERRLKDIEEAIERYKAVDFAIPRDWILEYFVLKEKL